MKINFKNQKGATGLDVGIAVIVIVLFISIITMVFYQIYRVTTEAARNAEATSYITRIFEKIESLDYEQISEENGSRNKIENILKEVSGENQDSYNTTTNQYEIKISGYNITINIENYNENNNEIEDVIKKVTINANYLVNKIERNIKISTVVTKK